MNQQQKPGKPLLPKSNSNNILKYAGLATQILVLLGLAVFAGSKLDERLHFSTPVLIWVLPLLAIFFFIFRIIKETSNKGHDNKSN
jgi:membrane protein DedA with SNARE-associated domain